MFPRLNAALFNDGVNVIINYDVGVDYDFSRGDHDFIFFNFNFSFRHAC